ncbi:MAG: beta-propeller fold lactonase family protein [Bacteroidia bacterium]|nr:beta-propeller fold lactonase family protein [Bacteroidia bacterium]
MVLKVSEYCFSNCNDKIVPEHKQFDIRMLNSSEKRTFTISKVLLYDTFIIATLLSCTFHSIADKDYYQIVIFKRDKQTGLLTDTGKRINVGKPVCLKWMKTA